MNAITRYENAALPALSMPEEELISVLQSSLYPGSSKESVRMVLGYCKAQGLDPLQKPAHIVPMWDKTSKQMRDVIMPGIGLYRTQAARSGALAGISEPEFGPILTEDLGGYNITYPEWCKVTVSRAMPTGQIAQFTAREFWIENYAVAGRDSIAPNAMWKKRPRGQLAKCAQAQALRMAFPEMTGSQPTAEEMEGAVVESDFRAAQPQPQPATPMTERVDFYPDDQFKKNLPAWQKVIESGRKTPDQIITMAQTKHPLTDAQKDEIRALKAKPQEQANEQAKPAVTFAQVAEKLHAAKDDQQLDDAATLIGEVADPEQRKELAAIYEQRRAASAG